MLRLAAIAAVLALPLCSPLAAAAQERAPTERAYLLELSYALGESHALRQACAGPNDQYWRQRMQRLVETERADEAFDGQLRDRFNTGFAAGQAQHPGCDAQTKKAEAQAAARGQALARNLASAVLGPAAPGAVP